MPAGKPERARAKPDPEAKSSRRKKEVGRLYWSISEVAELAGVKPHVLRYWETEFPSFKPSKNSAGNRVYRERDVELALAIRTLLHKERYTIKGAQKKLAETRKVRELVDQLEIPFARADQRQALKDIRDELIALRKLLGGK
ncbi:MAG: MerR family transcriptional regulator [Candidatus Krumholzibacteriia bacterium]|nr:MerR family transcriptional regulator [bacterium]MCB9515128.1 MerR family transcriptional regulator [Candidatus Latescibacterota bacterium]